MAKYTCEFDTETHEFKFFIDGNETVVDSAAIGCYEYRCGECAETKEPQFRKCVTASFGKRKGNEYDSKSIEIVIDKEGKHVYSSQNSRTSESIAKLITRDVFAGILTDSIK